MDLEGIINVGMMSRFTLSYGGAAIDIKESVAPKAAEFLAALLFYGDKGAETSELLDMLFYDEEKSSAADIDDLAFQLRRALAASVLPEGDYIRERGGSYSFGGPAAVQNDVRTFCTMYEMAEECDDDGRYSELLANCCALYGGELLPDWSQRHWVVYQNAKLIDMYTDSVRQLCIYYGRNQRYEELAELCRQASGFFPFDEEWHVNRINALTSMGDYRRALEEYEAVTSMLFDEMGVYPSEKLMDCVRIISAKNIFSSDSDDRLGDLDETGFVGAYYCNYPAFIEGYRAMKRIMDRDGIPSSLLLCTMTDKNGVPLEDHARIALAAQKLRYALSRTLRKSDIYTRYSTSQMLVMLWGTASENTGLIEERITAMLDMQKQKTVESYVQFAVIDGDAPFRMQESRPRKKWKKIKE